MKEENEGRKSKTTCCQSYSFEADVALFMWEKSQEFSKNVLIHIYMYMCIYIHIYIPTKDLCPEYIKEFCQSVTTNLREREKKDMSKHFTNWKNKRPMNKLIKDDQIH